MSYMIAGIDVHKRVLMVVVGDAGMAEGDMEFECRRFVPTCRDVQHMAAWLEERGVREVVMESTAQYWKPVWLALEGRFEQHLAQAWSNRAPKGRKWDFRDAQRLVRRHVAGELSLSFVPDAEQRQMRALTRRRVQLTGDRVRLQNQLEALLEDNRIKLSSVITDLLGATGIRILTALAAGDSDATKLSELGDARLKCTRQQLRDALAAAPLAPAMCVLLRMLLEQVAVLDRHLQQTCQLAAQAMVAYQDVLARLTQVPGIRVLAAQQILAETGPKAAAFPSAAQFGSWMGACPGREESAERNHSSRCPKGNRYLRRTLCQAAQAAVRTDNSQFQVRFRKLLPRLGYGKAIWAIVRYMAEVIWKILHTGVHYQEHGGPSSLQSMKRRYQRLNQEMRALGYVLEIKPTGAARP